MREDSKIEISEKEHAKAIIKKGFPLMLLSGCDVASQFIRIYLISRLDKDALASTMISVSITSFIALPLPLLMSQNAVFIAEKFGKIKKIWANTPIIPHDGIESKEQEYIATVGLPSENNSDLYWMIGSFVRQGWLLAFCISVPTSLFLFSMSPYFVSLFNQEEKLEDLANNYLRPFAFSIPFQYVLTISERFVSGVDQEICLIPYRLFTFVTELILNYFLIQKFALAGAAYAQIIKNIISICTLLNIFIFKNSFKKFKIFSIGLGDTSYIRKTLAQGWPMTLSQLVIICNAYIMSIFNGYLGPGRLGIEQILGQYFGLATVINNFGIAESANRIVSQYCGANNFSEMNRAGIVSLKLNVAIFTVIAIIYNSCPQQLASLFLNDADTANLQNLIRFNFLIVTVSNFFGIIQENCRACLTAVNDTALTSGTVLSINTGLVLPLAALTTYVFGFDLYGITGSIALGALVSLLIISKYWIKHNAKIIASGNNVITSNEKFSQCYNRICWKRRNYTTLNETSELISFSTTPQVGGNDAKESVLSSGDQKTIELRHAQI